VSIAVDFKSPSVLLVNHILVLWNYCIFYKTTIWNLCY